MIGNVLLLDKRIGDVALQGDFEFVIQLYSDHGASDDGASWVDFIVAEVIGFDVADGAKFFQRRGSMRGPDPVYAIDDAEFVASGHVKWDGCTEFRIAERGSSRIHTCSRSRFDQILAVVGQVRQLAAGVMHPPRYNFTGVRAEYDAELGTEEEVAFELELEAIRRANGPGVSV